jgi:predicted LPLAT superfamily acyltransferase
MNADHGEQALHWTERRETASAYWQPKLLHLLFRLLPAPLLRRLAFPVGFVYFLASRNVRIESRRYLDKAAAFRNRRGVSGSGRLSVLKHIIAFALALVEKVEAWGGAIDFRRIHFQDDDSGALLDLLEKGGGAVLLCSHLGNTELLRALADYSRTGVSRNIPVISVIDAGVTPFFSRMLGELNPRSRLRILNARDINAGALQLLAGCLGAGGLAVIAADRTPPDHPASGESAAGNRTRHRPFSISFLGAAAQFPPGPFFLASLLDAPVYAVFALRRGGDLSVSPEYNMHVRRIVLSASGDTPRRGRLERAAREFAALLESYCLEHPYQWYNFFNFWRPHGSPPPERRD